MSKNNDGLLWVERLAQTLQDYKLHKLEFETEDVSLVMRAKQILPARVPPVTAEPTEQDVEEEDVTVIRSLNVGIFKPSSHFDAGVEIKKGEKLGTIEAVSVEHDLLSEYTGILVEVVVRDGDPVEYGQPLFVLSEKEG